LVTFASLYSRSALQSLRFKTTSSTPIVYIHGHGGEVIPKAQQEYSGLGSISNIPSSLRIPLGWRNREPIYSSARLVQ